MKPTPGTIVGGLLMAALGAAAWWGGTELTKPEAPPCAPSCTRLSMESESATASAVVCPGEAVRVNGWLIEVIHE